MLFIKHILGVDSLFNKLSCRRGAIDEMLGAQKGLLLATNNECIVNHSCEYFLMFFKLSC